jgi:hypothetical protein
MTASDAGDSSYITGRNVHEESSRSRGGAVVCHNGLESIAHGALHIQTSDPWVQHMLAHPVVYGFMLCLVRIV